MRGGELSNPFLSRTLGSRSLGEEKEQSSNKGKREKINEKIEVRGNGWPGRKKNGCVALRRQP